MLADLVFTESVAAGLFTTGRLSAAFTSPTRTFEPRPIEWALAGNSATAAIPFAASTSVVLDGIDIYDGKTLVEHRGFTDENGLPDSARLIQGMSLEYSLVLTLGQED